MTSTRPQLRACDAGMEHNMSQQGSDCAYYKYVPRPNLNPTTHQITDRTLAIDRYRLARRTSPLLLLFYYYHIILRSTFVTLCNDLNHFSLGPQHIFVLATTQHGMDGSIVTTYSIHCLDRSHSSLNARVRDNGI